MLNSLTVHDQLFGAFDVPEDIIELLRCPEIQRLRDIRLINMSSLGCQSLSEVRRLSHTLGVLRLAMEASHKLAGRYSAGKLRTFLFAAVLHDVATPAFAHLFERELLRRYSWHHEHMISTIIRGSYRPENIDHQVYFKSPLSVQKVLRKFDVEPDEVFDLISGKGELGPLIAGSLDLDNLDNVFRMFSFLGFDFDRRAPLRIARSLDLWGGRLAASEEVVEDMKLWTTARRKSYEVLFFNPQNLCMQAMLSECFAIAVENRLLGPEYWHLTDEEILRRLLEYSQTKATVKRIAMGRDFDVLGILWLKNEGALFQRLSDDKEIKRFAHEVKRTLDCSVLTYVVGEKGSFSKELQIMLNPSSAPVCLSRESRTIIVGLFNRTKTSVSSTDRRRAQEILMSHFAITSDDLMRVPRLHEIYDFDSQKELPL